MTTDPQKEVTIPMTLEMQLQMENHLRGIERLRKVPVGKDELIDMMSQLCRLNFVQRAMAHQLAGKDAADVFDEIVGYNPGAFSSRQEG